MARVPNQLLSEWATVIDEVAALVDSGEEVPDQLVLDLRSVTAGVSLILHRAEQAGDIKSRRGLGRGLESLIPSLDMHPEDLTALRDRLREIAASADQTSNDGTTPGVA